MKIQLEIGTRVFNGGDMANCEHFGTITAINTSKWGTHVEITPDADSDRTKPYSVPDCVFCEKYLGHGGTRFVTEAAYKAFRAEQIERMQKEYAAIMARRAAQNA